MVRGHLAARLWLVLTSFSVLGEGPMTSAVNVHDADGDALIVWREGAWSHCLAGFERRVRCPRLLSIDGTESSGL